MKLRWLLLWLFVSLLGVLGFLACALGLIADPARADAPLIWGASNTAQMLNSGGLVAKDGSVYPKFTEKNYLAAGAFSIGAAAAPFWNASSAAITCTTTTTGLPDASAGTALAVTGVSGSTDYCFANFDLDQADYNKKMKLAFDQAPQSGYAASDQRVDVYSCTVAWSGSPATTCSGTSTRLPLSTDSSSVSALPNLTGTYRTTWDSPGSAAAHIQVRVGLNAATTHQNNLAQIVTGPGVVTQGAALGPWTSYSPTIANQGTVTTTYAEWRRNGESIDVRGYFAFAVPTANPIKVPLPTGITARTGGVNIVLAGNAGTDYTGNTTVSGFTPIVLDADKGNIQFSDNISRTIFSPINGSTFVANGGVWNFAATVPTNEYAGSGTVNLAQSDLSYYYGTGGTWGTSATITTAQGQGGVLGGTTTPGGAFFSYTFTPTTPVPVGAVPQLQISSDAIHWSNVGGVQATGPFVENLRNDGTNYIGASASLNNSGQITVYFGKYAAGTATAWSGTWYWRVAVGLPGQAVGFGAATRSALGLVYGSNSKARAHLGTNQSCGAASTCVVLYDTKNGTYDFDTNGELDVTTNKGRFTATSSGYYHVHCTATVDSAATTDGDSINVYKNGQRLGGGLWTGSTNLTFAADDTVLLNGTTDYVDCRVYNGNVSSRSIDSNANDPGATVIQVIQLQ